MSTHARTVAKLWCVALAVNTLILWFLERALGLGLIASYGVACILWIPPGLLLWSLRRARHDRP